MFKKSKNTDIPLVILLMTNESYKKINQYQDNWFFNERQRCYHIVPMNNTNEFVFMVFFNAQLAFINILKIKASSLTNLHSQIITQQD